MNIFIAKSQNLKRTMEHATPEHKPNADYMLNKRVVRKPSFQNHIAITALISGSAGEHEDRFFV